MIQIRILIVLLASVMSMNIWAQTAFEFDFDDKSLHNKGSKEVTVKSIGKPLISYNELYLNGSSGIEIKNTGKIEVISLLFQSDLPINSNQAGKALFYSSSFGAFVSSFTYGFEAPYIGWSDLGQSKVSGGSHGTIDMKWHHFMLVYEANTYRMFLDGQELEQISNSTKTVKEPLSASVMRFGINSVGGGGFIGNMDNIKIYNDALSVTALNQLIATEKQHVDYLNVKYLDVIRAKPLVELKFSGDYTNSGVASTVVSPIGTAFVSKRDSLLVLDGEGGVSIAFSEEVKGFSFLFKAVKPITAESPRQIIFHSGIFGGYFSDFTNAFSDEVVGFGFVPSGHRVYGNSESIDTLWHHLLFRFTEDDKNIELYIDGAKKSMRETGTVGLKSLKPGILTIGSTSALLNGFKGFMDNVMIFSDNVDDSDVDVINRTQKALLEKLNKKDLSSLMTDLRAYFKFDNTLEDEIGGLDMDRLVGTVQYVTDISGNSMLDLDGKTALYSTLVLDTLGGFSCYFKLNENFLTGTSSSDAARILFSSYFDKTKYLVSIGNVTTVVSNEVISVVRANDDKAPSLQYTTSHAINSSDWYHVFINFNKDNKRYDIYLNGNKIVSRGEIDGSVLKLNGVMLGALLDNLSMRGFLNAYIDEVKFYRRSQSESVIMNEYKEFEKNVLNLNVITSIERFDGVEPVSVYPNPLNEEMKLIIKGVDNPHYRVLTMDGSILTEGQGEEIALPSAGKGIFMVEVISNHVRNVFKVVR